MSAASNFTIENIVDVREQIDGFDETRLRTRRQVDLRRIAGHDHFRTFADTGQKHFHLHAGGVLRFVENDEGVRQRAATHECQRRNFDDARLDIALDFFGRQNIVKCVVKRPQIGIDLIAHVAGQKAEPLSGFNGRSRKNNPLYKPALKAMRREGNRDVGFSSTGRANAQDEIMLINGAYICALCRRARFNDPAAGCDLRLSIGHRSFGARMTDQAVDIASSDGFALPYTGVEPFQDASGDGAGIGGSRQDDDVAVSVRVDAQSIFYEGQVAIVFPKQLRQQPIVFEGHNDASRFEFWLIRPPRRRRGGPAECCQS